MKYSLKFNEYIDQTIAIICENLSPAEQINIESLLILDIHGMMFIFQSKIQLINFIIIVFPKCAGFSP